MTHRILFAAALAAFVAAPTAVLAQSGPAARPAQSAAPTRVATRADVLKMSATTFARFDTNKDGSLSKAEVEAAEVQRRQAASQAMQARLNQEFAKLDTDRNNQLSQAEFRAAVPQLRPAAGAGDAIARLDSNKDGRISVDEYRAPTLTAFDRLDSNKDGTLSAAERAKAPRTASR